MGRLACGVNKPFRLIIWLLSAGVILFALFILAVNLYVQSEGVKRKIQTQLSEAVGLPVDVFRTSYTPWGGFRLSKIQCRRSADSSSGEAFLTLDRVEVQAKFFSLLQGQVNVSRLLLHAPELTIRQEASGTWPWPGGKVAKPISKPPAPAPSRQTPAPATSPASAPQAAAAESAAPPARKKTPSIQKILLREGTFRLVDRDGVEQVLLENLRLSATTSGAAANFDGVLRIPRILIQGRWEITGFSSPVSLRDGLIDIQKMEADCAGGRLRGHLNLQTSQPGTPFALNLKLSKILLASLCSPDSDLADQVTGQFTGELNLAGLATKSGSNHGGGGGKIIGGQFKQYPMLQMIGRILRTEELDTVQLKKADLRVVVKDSVVQIQPLELASQNLRLTAVGDIARGREMDLQCLLIVNETTFKRLPSEARENFQPVPETRDRALSFKVFGEPSQPRTDFVKRLVGDRLQRKWKGFLDGMINGKPAPGKAPATNPEDWLLVPSPASTPAK